MTAIARSFLDQYQPKNKMETELTQAISDLTGG